MVALQERVRKVKLDPALAGYIQNIAQATRTSPLLTLGISTRGSLALAAAARARAVLRGRAYVIADDIQELAVPVLAHRVRLASARDGFAATREEEEAALRDIVARLPVPL
jgi:MoxR-like ATPase